MAFGTPYLLSLGLSKQATSLVWLAGPLSGLLVQPAIGALSDRSTSRYRRRFFIALSATLVVISTLVVAYAHALASVLASISGLGDWDPETEELTKQRAIFLAVVGFYVLDFSLNGLQASLRALILDQSPRAQQVTANAWHGRMTHIANIFGYLAGYLNLGRWDAISWVGGGQFRKLAVLSCVVMSACVAVTCWTQVEKVGRPEPTGEGGVMGVFNSVLGAIKNLPLSVKRVCYVQFFAWTAYFPFLFYSTTYVAEVLYLSLPPSSPPPSSDTATRAGSLALLLFAIVSLISGTFLPYLSTILLRPAVARRISTTTTRGKLVRRALARCSPRNMWTFGLVLWACGMLATFWVKTVNQAMVVIATLGICWAISCWVPFALVMEAIRDSTPLPTSPPLNGSSPSPPDTPTASSKPSYSPQPFRAQITVGALTNGADLVDVAKSDDGGTVLGIHNLSIVAPQFIVAIIAALIFRILEASRAGSHAPEAPGDGGLSGSNDVVWVLRFGGIAAVGGAVMSRWVLKTRSEREYARIARKFTGEERYMSRSMDIHVQRLPSDAEDLDLIESVADAVRVAAGNVRVHPNFQARTWSHRNQRQIYYNGTITVTDISIGQRFLRAHELNTTIRVKGAQPRFSRSNKNPTPELISKLRTSPFVHPAEERKRQRELRELATPIGLVSLQFGRLADHVFSPELEMPTLDGKVVYRGENRAITITFNIGERRISVNIPFNTISKALALRGTEPAVLLLLSRPPTLSHVIRNAMEQLMDQFAQLLRNAPQFAASKRLPGFGVDDQARRPFIGTTVRLVFSSKSEVENFCLRRREAHLPAVVHTTIAIQRRDLYSPRNLEAVRSTMTRLNIRVAFQIDLLLHNGILDASQLAELAPDFRTLERRHGVPIAERVLAIFGAMQLSSRHGEKGDWEEEIYDADDDTSTYSRPFGPLLHQRPAATSRVATLREELTQIIERVQSLPPHRFATDQSSVCRHVVLTPTGRRLEGPFPDVSNSILRRYEHPECFVRVSIRDEDFNKIRFDRTSDVQGFLRDVFLPYLTEDGLKIGGRKFNFLGYSSSALRDHSVWFVTSFKQTDGTLVTAESIRSALGDFSRVNNIPARWMARIAQAFTATYPSVTLKPHEIDRIPDIEFKNYHGAVSVFTDGVGTISPSLAAEVDVALARNLTKFQRGQRVKPTVYQREAVTGIQAAKSSPSQAAFLLERGRIPIQDGYTLVGIADEDQYLGENEIYACIKRKGKKTIYLEGDICISRSPTIHPGDVRMVHAVGRLPPGSAPFTEYQTNAVVFSTKDILNDLMGVIATRHLHLADVSPMGTESPECLKLSGLHSDAVDFAKTGVSARFPDIPKAAPLMPDFMAPEWRVVKASEDYYESPKVLGQLFRDIPLEDLNPPQRPSGAATLDSHDIISATLTQVAIDGMPDGVLGDPYDDLCEEMRHVMERFTEEFLRLARLHTLSRRQDRHLSEEETFAGTMVAHSRDRRLRNDTITQLHEHTATLFDATRLDILGYEEEEEAEQTNRAWAAWTVARSLDQRKFGVKSFGYLALEVLLSQIATMNGEA
ncbi:hypothetical protein RQP46_007759 [Phenoliferia psychrophenolica]